MDVKDKRPEIDYEQVKKDMIALKAKKQELVKNFFGAKSKVIFDQYPALESFGFYCYSAYYCDGGPCDFEVHTDYCCGLMINGLRGDELCEETYDKTNNRWNYKFAEGIPEDATYEVKKFLDSIDEDDYEEMFGTDTEVTVTREGVEIESYTDHD
jgi:hypothetical protein